jgi:hypothetical protein
MENLAKAIVKENEKNNNWKVELINNLTNTDIKNLDWRLKELLTAGQKKKQYILNELKEVLKIRLKKESDKRNETDLQKLQFNDLQSINELTITVEWKKSSMWGMNPAAESYINGVGFVSSGSISGCGYDKGCTAVARVLNQVPQFQKLMFELKDKTKNVNLKNHDIFGYGSGYGVLPSFEGGVGVSCYDRIFNKIGYKFETVSSGKTFDVYKITKIGKKELKQRQ